MPALLHASLKKKIKKNEYKAQAEITEAQWSYGRVRKSERVQLHLNTIESQLCDLGVRVIWYEDHKEVPEILRKIIAPLR